MLVGHLVLALACAVCELPSEAAEHLWDQGQEAMRQGKPQQAVQFYQRSLVADPGLVRNYLSLAAALLEMDEDAAALPYLERYVRARPDQLIIRIHLADLLLRLERPSDARAEFERCVAWAQDRDDLPAQLVHCHTRLMEIAEAENDGYAEHLHRGIGLFLLAGRRAALPEPDGDLSSEALLCKAAGELALAHLERADEARPALYLYEVWSRLAQQQPARRFLRIADQTAPFSYLTTAERRGLQLARRCREFEGPIK